MNCFIVKSRINNLRDLKMANATHVQIAPGDQDFVLVVLAVQEQVLEYMAASSVTRTSVPHRLYGLDLYTDLYMDYGLDLY